MASEDISNEVTGLSILKNTTDSFLLWNLEILTLFETKNLLNIVEGKEIKPDEDKPKEREQWCSKDTKARYYILRTIEKNVKSHIVTCKSSKEMYDSLCSIYQRDTEQLKCNLMSELFNYKYDKQQTLMNNISAIQNLVYRLKNLREQISDQMVISKILSCLPDHYKFFSTAWESTTADQRTLANLKTRLAMEEEKSKGKDQPQVAFNTEKKKIKCAYCHKPGHTKEVCRKRISKENSQQQGQKMCKKCGRSNHTEEECYSGKTFPECKYCHRTNHPEEKCLKNREKRNFTKVNFYAEKHNYKCDPDSEDECDEKVCFTAETSSTDTSDTKFCVDSGCSSHMSKNEELLTDKTNKPPEKIKVAKKGDSMITSVEGKIVTKSSLIMFLLCQI